MTRDSMKILRQYPVGFWALGTLRAEILATAKTGHAELLGRRLSLVRIQDETRRHGADQFLGGCSKISVKLRHRQIQNAHQGALKGQNQIRVTGRATTTDHRQS